MMGCSIDPYTLGISKCGILSRNLQSNLSIADHLEEISRSLFKEMK